MKGYLFIAIMILVACGVDPQPDETTNDDPNVNSPNEDDEPNEDHDPQKPGNSADANTDRQQKIPVDDDHSEEENDEEGGEDQPGDDDGDIVDEDPPDPDPITYERVRVAAIGDSITASMNVVAQGEQRQYSWSTGRQLENSHAQRFASQLNVTTVETSNVAISGSRANSLSAQVSQINLNTVDYATINIGANDICAWTVNYQGNLAGFENNVEAGIEALVANSPDVKVLLAPVPDMVQLYDLKSGDARCRAIWNSNNLCTFLMRGEFTPTKRAALTNMLTDVNDILEDVATRYTQVKFNRALAETEFLDEHVSTVDCYHPSIAGHELLATETWDEIWAKSALNQ